MSAARPLQFVRGQGETEKGLGGYVGVEQHDQITVIAKGGVNRQTVVEGRLMLQAGF